MEACNREYYHNLIKRIDTLILENKPLKNILEIIFKHRDNEKDLNTIFESVYISELLKYPYLKQFTTDELNQFLELSKYTDIEKVYFFWQFLAINDIKFHNLEKTIIKNLHRLKDKIRAIYPAYSSVKQIDKRFIQKIRSGNFNLNFLEIKDIKDRNFYEAIFINYILTTNLFENKEAITPKICLLRKLINNILENNFNNNNYIHIITIKLIIQILNHQNIDQEIKDFIINKIKKSKKIILEENKFLLKQHEIRLLKEFESYEEIKFFADLNWINLNTPKMILTLKIFKPEVYEKIKNENKEVND